MTVDARRLLFRTAGSGMQPTDPLPRLSDPGRDSRAGRLEPDPPYPRWPLAVLALGGVLTGLWAVFIGWAVVQLVLVAF